MKHLKLQKRTMPAELHLPFRAALSAVFKNLVYTLCLFIISFSYTGEFKYQPHPSIPSSCKGLLKGTVYLHEVLASQQARRTKHRILPANDMTDLENYDSLSAMWNEPPKDVPHLINLMLPAETTPINHQLAFNQHFSAVKTSGGDLFAPIRAKYTYHKEGKAIVLGTNAYAASTFLYSNLLKVLEGTPQERSLSDSRAEYTAFLISGGGTQSASGSIYGPAASNLASYGVHTISIDTEMHSEGSRHLFESAEEQTRARMAFINQHVDPGQKIIIGGHSLGGTEAIRIWTMLNEDPSLLPNNEVLAVAAFSPGLDPAPPGSSPAEKIDAFKQAERRSRIMSKTEAPEHERDLWSTELVLNRKMSFLGELYTLDNLSQLRYSSLLNNPIPLYIVIGKWDPLFLGYDVSSRLEQLGRLHNVHIIPPLDEKPLLKTKEMTRVGHALPDYQFSIDNDTPLHIHYILNFLSETSGVPLEEMKKNNLRKIDNSRYVTLYELALLYLKDLAFRSWLSRFEIEREEASTQAVQIKNEARAKIHQEARAILIKNTPINLFAQEIRFLAKVQSEEDMQQSLDRLKNLTQLLAQIPQLEAHIDSILSVSSPESARQTARNTAQLLFRTVNKSAAPAAVSQITSASDITAVERFLRSFPENSSHWAGDISYDFIPDKTKQEILSAYRSFKNTKDKTERKALSSRISSLIEQRLPINILYDILIILTERPFLSLEEYQNEFQKYRSHVSLVHQSYKNSPRPLNDSTKSSSLSLEDLTSLLHHTAALAAAESIEQMIETGLQLLQQYSHIQPISKTMINKSGIINSKVTQDQLRESLRRLQLSPQDIDRAANMFNSSTIGRRPIYDFIREKALTTQVHSLLKLIKSLTAGSIIEQLKQYILPLELQAVDWSEVHQLIQTSESESGLNSVHSFIESLKASLNNGWALNQIEQISKAKKPKQQDNLAVDFIKKLYSAYWLYNKLQDIQTADPESKAVLAYQVLEQGRFFRYFNWINQNDPAARSLIQSLGTDLTMLENALYSDEIKNAVRSRHQNLERINQVMAAVHVPALQDFYDHYERNQAPFPKSAKQDQQFLSSITQIRGIVKQIASLKEEFSGIRESSILLLEDINGLQKDVNHALRILDIAINKTFRNPPPSLQEEYKKLESLLDDLIKLYDSLEIDIFFDDFILPFLDGSQTRSNQAYISAVENNTKMQELREKIKIIENRLFPTMESLEPEFVSALIRGELEDMVPGSQQAAVDLYGQDGRALYNPDSRQQPSVYSKYTEWQYKALQLAKNEARIIAIKAKLAHLKQNYHMLYPDMIQYVSSFVNGAQLLDPAIKTSGEQARELHKYIDFNMEEFDNLHRRYIEMRGRVVPAPLPLTPRETPI